MTYKRNPPLNKNVQDKIRHKILQIMVKKNKRGKNSEQSGSLTGKIRIEYSLLLIYTHAHTLESD